MPDPGSATPSDRSAWIIAVVDVASPAAVHAALDQGADAVEGPDGSLHSGIGQQQSRPGLAHHAGDHRDTEGQDAFAERCGLRGPVLDLVDASTAEHCARIAQVSARPDGSAFTVRTRDPRTARRAADIAQALAIERAGGQR